MSWRVAGTYFESCNCEAICPCRTVAGVPGGRSTYGECYGVLCWRVEAGEADGLDLTGLAVAMAIRYEDDEPGSPWTFVLYVDERADAPRRAALEAIFLGRAGGEGILALPWVRKPSELVEVRPARIEIEHGPAGHELRVADRIELRALRPVETEERVSCVIPGHHVAGTELYADVLRVADEPFAWELAGTCAFTSAFEYADMSGV